MEFPNLLETGTEKEAVRLKTLCQGSNGSGSRAGTKEYLLLHLCHHGSSSHLPQRRAGISK